MKRHSTDSCSLLYKHAYLILSMLAIVVLTDAPRSALAQTTVGTLPGQVGVTATGAAAYSIPIAIPPGTGGMAPNLALQYSSQNGDGLVGMGWSLSGLPRITRCMLNPAQDGYRYPITFTTNDRFCLNGQRLVAISGTYGANGTVYRTEVDNFMQVVSYGTTGNGPTYFIATDRTGKTIEFGNTADSKAIAVGTSTVATWAVDKVKDTWGNYYTVSYCTDYGGTSNGNVIVCKPKDHS